jgi:transcriptional regulator with XRE-family HTH domain
MRVNAALIAKLRKERSWSQDELSAASGLNLRTIQRIEKHGSASLQSMKALAAAFNIDTRDLDSEENRMKPCPVCGSNEIYEYDEFFEDPAAAGGATLFPHLGGILRAAKMRPAVCHGCGNVRLFISEEARLKLKTAKHWKLAGT